MDKKYYLLLKQHNVTGLKYLCYHNGTSKSCFTYNGSGLYWLKHLKKHGKDISTIILLESNDKSDISKEGIKYSTLWDVVNSKDFANLIIENAESDASKLHTVEAREKRKISLAKRIANKGLTESEKEAKKHAISIMHLPKNREKAYASIRKRFQTGNLTEKQLNRGQNTIQRISEFGFTQREIDAHSKVTQRQLGLTMKERLGKPEWVNPNKGKSAIEIHGVDYIDSRKGKNLKDIRGENYINPLGTPFKLVINDNDIRFFESDNEFLRKCKMTSKMMPKFKETGVHIIRRQKNSTHEFKSGDIFKYFPLSIEEYKEYNIDKL